MLTLHQYEMTRDYLLLMKHKTLETIAEAKTLAFQDQIEHEQRRRIKELEGLEKAIAEEIDALRAESGIVKGKKKCQEGIDARPPAKRKIRSSVKKCKTREDGTSISASSAKNANGRKPNAKRKRKSHETNG